MEKESKSNSDSSVVKVDAKGDGAHSVLEVDLNDLVSVGSKDETGQSASSKPVEMGQLQLSKAGFGGVSSDINGFQEVGKLNSEGAKSSGNGNSKVEKHEENKIFNAQDSNKGTVKDLNGGKEKPITSVAVNMEKGVID
jgi:hypothetical protein